MSTTPIRAFTASLLGIALLIPATAAPISGLIEVQHSPYSIEFAEPPSPGVALYQAGSNLGDFALDFTGYPDDLAAGALVSSVAERARDNGTGTGAVFATSAVSGAGNNLIGPYYWIPVANAPGGGEFNANTAFAFLPYDEWLGGRCFPSVGIFVGLESSTPGLDESTLFRSGPGRTSVDLREYGASSADGVLLASSYHNSDSFAQVEAESDGRFLINNRDNGTEGSPNEDQPMVFAYVGAADVGTRAVAAMGRVNGDGSTDVAGGEFTITDAGQGQWDLSIAGHSPSTGTLIVQPAVAGVISGDNVVVSEWTGAAWRVVTRDIEPAVTNPQEIPAAEDAFSFVFFEHPASATTPSLGGANLASGGRATQSSTQRLPFPARADATLAIDGGTSSWQTATDPADDTGDPWWELELARDAEVTAVEILGGIAGHRSRLRDIRIELLDAGRTPIATSPLLNPENSGFAFPAGPGSLSFSVPATAGVARYVRVTRVRDGDLSGTGGLGDTNILSLREVVVAGRFVGDELGRCERARYDVAQPDPDPVSQGWEAEEIRTAGSLADGEVGAWGNAGLSVGAGGEVAWQLDDQQTDEELDSPVYSRFLAAEDLRDAYELGWTFSATVRPVSVVTEIGLAGYTGFYLGQSVDPGWGLEPGGGGAVTFQFGKNAAGELICYGPWATTPVVVGPADAYYTLSAVGAPRSNTYEWFIDGVSQGTVDIAESSAVAGDSQARAYFGGGNFNTSGQVANFKSVSFKVGVAPDLPGGSDLVFYLPFEPGPLGDETFYEQSNPPGQKPRVVVDGPTPSLVAGAAGAGVGFPGSTFLDASAAAAEVGALGEATISLWLRDSGTNVFALSDASEPDSFLRFQILGDGTAQVESFAAGSPTGTALAAAFPEHADGRWHHVAITLAAGGGKLYLDGSLADESNIGAPAAIAALDTFTLGALVTSNPGVSVEKNSGRLDEFAVWGRVLGAAEIANLHRLGQEGIALTFDRDQDSLNGFEEAALGTAEEMADSDGDGEGDLEEVARGTDPNLTDTDGDNQSDTAELAAGTDPRNADSDGDGSPDGEDPAPADPTVFPTPSTADEDGDGLTAPEEAALGTLADNADSDGDLVEDFVEVLLGTAPDNSASAPRPAVDADGDGFAAAQDPDDSDPAVPAAGQIHAVSIVWLSADTVRFDFTTVGEPTELKIESSADLATFTDLQSVPIEADGDYSVTLTAAGDRRFFRATGNFDGVTASTVAAALASPDDAVVEVTEGQTLNQLVQFGAPFTGYVSYTLGGLRPDGRPLPEQRGSVLVDGASSAVIPLTFFDDLEVSAPARYTLSLDANPGLAPALDSAITIVVKDNDERWSGTLGADGEIVNVVLECVQDSTTSLQRLISPDGAGLCPKGEFAANASFAGADFTASVPTVPLKRESGALAGGGATLSSLALVGTVEDTAVTGTATFTLRSPGAADLQRTGTFALSKEPPAVPPVDLDLETE